MKRDGHTMKVLAMDAICSIFLCAGSDSKTITFTASLVQTAAIMGTPKEIYGQYPFYLLAPT